MSDHIQHDLTFEREYSGDNWLVALVKFGKDDHFCITTHGVHGSDLDVGDSETNMRLWCSGPALHAWAIAAFGALSRGVDLIPTDQLREWEGVRAVLESCPLDVDVLKEAGVL